MDNFVGGLDRDDGIVGLEQNPQQVSGLRKDHHENVGQQNAIRAMQLTAN